MDARAKETVARLAKQLEDGSVSGRFVEQTPGSYVFAPEDPGLAIVPIANPNDVGALAVGPVVDMRGTVSGDRRSIAVVEYSLAKGKAAQALIEPDVDSPAGQAMAAAGDILQRLDRAAQPGAMSVEARLLDRTTPIGSATLQNMDQIAQAYRAAVEAGDQAAVDQIVSQWSTLRITITNTLDTGDAYKSIYGAPDYYPPWRYLKIDTDSAAVVAIGEPGKNTARCSGVLVAEDLVLTAAHCFSGASPQEPAMEPESLEIWFDYAELSTGDTQAPKRRRIQATPVAPPAALWPALMNREFSKDLYDYVIVRFAAPPGEPLIPNRAEPQCLKQASPHRGDPLYVVGYPQGGPATVHDHGRVLLPYRIVADDRFDLLRLDVEADFKDSDERAEIMRQFDASYILDTTGLIDWRYFFDVRDNGQPRMGIIADTFRGNSGGPVYDHEREQCVVGILNRGMGDTGMRLDGNWKQHERILPMYAILEDLKRRPETAALVSDGTLRIVK